MGSKAEEIERAQRLGTLREFSHCRALWGSVHREYYLFIRQIEQTKEDRVWKWVEQEALFMTGGCVVMQRRRRRCGCRTRSC